MNTNETIVTIKKLSKQFEKINRGINKQQLNALNNELLKIYPSNQSEVLLSTDYDDEENSVGMSIYVSNPQTADKIQKTRFDKLMFEYLLLSDINKLPDVFKCIELMERIEGDKYDVDFIPVFYTKQIGKHDIHFRITKK